MYVLKNHQICSFFSQMFIVEVSLSSISEHLRRLQKYTSLFGHCHPLLPFKHPAWCSSWPFFILKQKPQVLKFTGPEVFSEDLSNSLGPWDFFVQSLLLKAKLGGLSAVCREQWSKGKQTTQQLRVQLGACL